MQIKKTHTQTRMLRGKNMLHVYTKHSTIRILIFSFYSCWMDFQYNMYEHEPTKYTMCMFASQIYLALDLPSTNKKWVNVLKLRSTVPSSMGRWRIQVGIYLQDSLCYKVRPPESEIGAILAATWLSVQGRKEKISFNSP